MAKSKKIQEEIAAEKRRSTERLRALKKELAEALREEAAENPAAWLAVRWTDGTTSLLPVTDGQEITLADPEGIYERAFVRREAGNVTVIMDCDGYWEGGYYSPSGVNLQLGEGVELAYEIVAALAVTKEEAEAILASH